MRFRKDSENRKSDVTAEVDSRLAYLGELQVLQKKLVYFVQTLIELFSHKKISAPDYMNQFNISKKRCLNKKKRGVYFFQFFTRFRWNKRNRNENKPR